MLIKKGDSQNRCPTLLSPKNGGVLTVSPNGPIIAYALRWTTNSQADQNGHRNTKVHCLPLVINASQADPLVNQNVILDGEQVGDFFYVTSITLKCVNMPKCKVNVVLGADGNVVCPGFSPKAGVSYCQVSPAQPPDSSCPKELNQCGDGSYVGRTGGNCVFAPCPTEPPDVVCAQDVTSCPDGSQVGRTGPNCQFVCPTPKPAYTCPSGGYVNCMPGTGPANPNCSTAAINWFKANCPNFKGATY